MNLLENIIDWVDEKLPLVMAKTSEKRTPLSSGHQTHVPKVSATERFHYIRRRLEEHEKMKNLLFQ